MWTKLDDTPYEVLNEIYPISSESYNFEEVDQLDKNMNLCIIGHVDSGKSTLMGHIFQLWGLLSSQEIHKNKRES